MTKINLFATILIITPMFFKHIAATARMLLQVTLNQPETAAFSIVFSLIWRMLVKNLQVDVFLFLILFVLIGIDTFLGVILAKMRKNFEWSTFKQKTMQKIQGYIFFLMALFLLTIMVFIAGLHDGKPFFSEYTLNLPIMTTFLFFGAIEFVSIKNNIVAYSGIKVPTSVVDKVEDFIKNQDTEKNIFEKKPDE